MYIFCIHVLYIYLYFYISIYIYIILYLHLYHSISTSIYLQGHLGGHWLPSISINHPFQFLGTITFKSLNLPCSIKYLSEPSLSAWVRAAQSREEQQWQLGPQGPQDRGGDWGGGLRDGSSSGAAGREMGSASYLVVFFWLWSLSFLVWSFCWFLFWTWSMFFFLPCLLVGFSLEVPEPRFKMFNIAFPRAAFLGAPYWDSVPDPWFTFSAIFIHFIFPLNPIHFLDLSCQ